MLAISRGCDMLKKKQLWLQMMNWEFEKAAVISAEPSPERDAELKRLEECLKDARMQLSPEDEKQVLAELERERPGRG
jgi:hypothetical protein